VDRALVCGTKVFLFSFQTPQTVYDTISIAFMFELNTPVENLYLVGPARAKLLKNLGIATLRDLLFYFPRYHQDLSRFTPIADLKANEFANIKARVISVKSFRTRVRKLTITHVLVEDDSANILCVWFNQPFLSKVFKAGDQFLFSGKVVLSKNKLQLSNPIYEQEKAEQVHTARLVPVYPLTASLTQKQLRSVIKNYLDKILLPEYLPVEILREEKLLDENLKKPMPLWLMKLLNKKLKPSLLNLHHPKKNLSTILYSI
jgi:ATP-dependent DNA helicase RecG